MRSELLFETLDPHGHVIGHESITCPNCLAAIACDGWCVDCRIGWQNGLAWMTRITWVFSKGEVATASTPLCAACRARVDAATTAEGTGVSGRGLGQDGGGATERGAWCPACGGGVVGRIFFRDRELLAEAARQFDILNAAIATVPRCELCACAMVVDDDCPFCRIAYRDGKPLGTVDPPRR